MHDQTWFRRNANPDIALPEAQSVAWHEGRRLLERVISEGLDYAFETTLGGNSIAALLETVMDSGFEVRIWYVGLASPEPCVARLILHTLQASSVRLQEVTGKRRATCR